MEKIIIVGHGSLKDKANNLEFITQKIAKALSKNLNDVKFAYLQFGNPDLKETIEQCIKEGATKIIIHPLFISAGSHVTQDIPSIIDKFKKDYPFLRISCTKPLGLHEKIADFIAEIIEETRNEI